MMDELTETDRIEHDLAKTRARMDSRLDELQNHLTPKQMLNDAFGYFRGGDGAAFTNDLVARAKANPMPVALAGIGIVWLMMSKQDTVRSPGARASQLHTEDLEARMRSAEGAVERRDGEDDEGHSGRRYDARGAVLGLARGSDENTAAYAQRIKDAATAAKQAVARKSRDLAASMSGAANAAGDAATDGQNGQDRKGTKQMARTARDTFSSISTNPFALGAIAGVVGLVAGAMIPAFEQEEAALGSVATRVRTAGRDLAQEVVDRGGRIANDTVDAVKDSAQAHGLTADRPVGELIGEVTSGNIGTTIKDVAQETLQAGKDSVQHHVTDATQPAK